MKKVMIRFFVFILFLSSVFSVPAIACWPSCPGCCVWKGTCEPEHSKCNQNSCQWCGDDCNCKLTCLPKYCRECIDGWCGYVCPTQQCCDGTCFDWRTHRCCDRKTIYNYHTQKCCGDGNGKICDINKFCCDGSCCDPATECCDNGTCKPKCQIVDGEDCDKVKNNVCDECAMGGDSCGWTSEAKIYTGVTEKKCSPEGCPGDCNPNTTLCYTEYQCIVMPILLPFHQCSMMTVPDPPQVPQPCDPTCFLVAFGNCWHCGYMEYSGQKRYVDNDSCN